MTGSAVLLAVGLAFALEWTVAEPPGRVHPVAVFGRVVAPFDRSWARPGVVGALVAVGLPLVAAGVAGLAVAAAGVVSDLAAGAVAGVVLFVTTSLRMLLGEARGVIETADSEPAVARQRLPALAGRDPGSLSAGQLRSAAVESTGENLADGLVGPLTAFVLLSPLTLGVAAAGAAWVKAVNTLDSMLGYRSKPVGTASARLDDLVMWVPARLSAALIAVAAAAPGRIVAARPEAHRPASPNAGWPMGTLATALSVRLEKPGAYELNGEATLPTEVEARRGVRIVRRAGLLAYGLAALVGVGLWL